MKVAIFVSRIDSGGLSSVALAQLQALQNAQIATQLIQLNHGSRLKTIYDVLHIYLQRRHTYCVTHGFASDLLGFLLRKLGCKVSATVHAYLPEHVSYDYPRWSIKKFILNVSWRAISQHEANIFLTHHMRSYYAKYNKKIIRNNSAVIENFYQAIFDRVRNRKESGASIECLGLPVVLGSDKVFIAVAGNSFRKGYDNLEDFCQANPRVIVLNFGCKYLDSKFSNLINLPPCADWHNYLGVASGLIHMSRAEGQPLAVIETLMFGKPALVSQIPGHADLIEKFSSGVIFRPNLIELVPHAGIQMSDNSFINEIRRLAHA